jgi:hypothetical protein
MISRSNLTRCLLFVALIFAPFGLGELRAQPGDQLGAQAEHLIAQVAANAANEQRVLTAILARQGFPPNDWPPEQWRELRNTDVQVQLETAWLSAKKGGGIEAADAMLSNVIAEYREVNPAVSLDPELRAHNRTERTFAFPALTAADKAPQLPPSVEKLIDVVARHADGGLRIHMARCCQIEERRAVELIRRSPDFQAAIRTALIEGELPPELAKRLARLLESAIGRNASLVFDEHFAAVRPQLQEIARAQQAPATTEVTFVREVGAYEKLSAKLDDLIRTEGSTTLAHHGIRPEEMRHASDVTHILALDTAQPSLPDLGLPGGGGPHFNRFATGRNAAFDIAETSIRAPGPAGRLFMRVVGVAGGRGGVVLGNRVHYPNQLPHVETVALIPLASGAPSGHDDLVTFRLMLSDQSIAYSPPLPRSEAIAAVRLALTGYGELASFIPQDEAVELAGLDGHFDLPEIVDGPSLTLERHAAEDPVLSPGTAYVVHPAIADTAIGASAIVTDGLLMGKSRGVLDSLMKRRLTSTQVDEFESWYNGKPWSTYKFTDDELEIRLTDGVVRAVPTLGDHANGAPAPHLTFRRFGVPNWQGADKEGLLSEDRAQIARMMAMLIASSADIRRLDQFAEVLAILRWAKATGAEWFGNDPTMIQGPSYTATFIKDGRVELLGSREALALAFVEDVHHRERTRLDRDAAPEALLDLDDHTLAERERMVALAGISALFDNRMLRAILTAETKDDPKGEVALALAAGVEAFDRARRAKQSGDEAAFSVAKSVLDRADRRISELSPEVSFARSAAEERKTLLRDDPGNRSQEELLATIREKLTPGMQESLHKADQEAAAAQTAMNRLDERISRLERLAAGEEEPTSEDVLAFSSELVRKNYQARLDDINAAERSGSLIAAKWARLRLWWLRATPDPARIKEALERQKSERALAEAHFNEATARAQGGLVPGFVEWVALQKSFVKACPTGVCTD